MYNNHEKPLTSLKKYKKAIFISLMAFPLLGNPTITAINKEVSILEQNYSIHLKLKNETIANAIQKLSKQTGIHIVYSNDQIDIQRRINTTILTSNIQEALQIILGDRYKFIQENDYISIARIQDLTEIPTSKNTNVTQQRTSVSGLITDSDGNPIPGATVSIKGTTQGVTTDMDGHYTLTGIKQGDIIEFRFIGYNTEEIVYKKQEKINIRMSEASVNLDDVVVIGYGQQKKESVVASINSITAKELSMPTRSLSNNIAGQIAGVLAVQRSGEPGRDNSDFWIRGISSFAGGTSPLVLVDGVPRRMDDVTVDEVESFTVLKDASATAVYGAEGANGVILITSKRGKTQKTTLDIRAEFSVAKPTRIPSMLGSYDYLSLYNEARWEDFGTPQNWVKPYSDEVLELYRAGADPDLYPNADFLSLMKKNTQNGRVTLNLRGGSDRIKYFVSGAFYKENGIFDSQAIDKYDANIGLSRYNIRSNIDIAVTKTTDLSVDMSGQYLESNYPGASTDDIFEHIFKYAPHIFPLRFSDGRFSESAMYNGSSHQNPYNMLNESGYQKKWNAYIQSKISLNQKLDFITKGLSLKLSGSFDANGSSSTHRTKRPTSYRMELNENGEKEYILINEGQPNLTDPSSNGTSGQKQIYLEAALNYHRIFNNLHDVSGMVLYMQKDRQQQGSGLPYKKQSFVARASYGYDHRYLIESSFGLTGSENFAKGYRYGIFPSVGVAWYASNEAFMKDLEDIINKLKIRFSFGLTGNDNVGGARFPYRGTMTTNAPGYSLGFNTGAGGGGTNNPGSGIIEGNFAAPYLSWEIEEKNNIGLDLGLLRGRIDMSIDYFRNERRDILMQRKTVSAVAGFRKSPFQNFGKMRNQGFDGNLTFKQNINKVNLTFRGNVTYAKNKIIEYDEVKPKYDYQTYTGQSLGKPMLYIAEGLYKDDDFIIETNPENGSKSYTLKEGLAVPSSNVKPGDIKYKDLNGDLKIDSYDRTYDHKYYAQNPEWVYGFGIQGDYKGFYAGLFFQGVANASINIKSGNFIPFSNGTLQAVRSEALTDHWSSTNPDNQNVLFPRLHPDNYTHNEYNSTWWYRNGNFIRLKNVEFGYNFNSKMLQRYWIKRARLYVQGNNLAVWDHIKMWDPELGNASGGERYPINMTWTVGLELTF